MLDDALKTQLRSHFEKLTRPVVLKASVDDGAPSVELLSLLNELASLSDLVSVEVWRDDAERKPSFGVASPQADIHLRFAGLPMGHEFSSLVLALLQVGGHPSKATQALVEQVVDLEGDYHFETYFSLSCQNCPEVVQALNLAAVLNPRIHHEAIDGALFQEEVEAQEILAVPAVFLNGKPFDQGRMTLEQIVAKLDTGSASRQAQALSQKAPFEVLVVGSGPAGAAAAIYAARKGIRTGLAGERFGGQVLDTLAIENFISVSETEGPKLVASMRDHVNAYEIDAMELLKADALIPANGDGLIGVRLENGAELKSKTVVLATGARWRQLNVPGEDTYRNKGVAYCPHCDGPLFKGKRVAVVGGGNSGVEAAIDLAGLASHVTLLEFESGLRADEVLQRKLRSLPNVTVVFNAQTKEVVGDGKRVTGLVYTDRLSGTQVTVDLEGIFVQIGLLPNTEWLAGTVALSNRGEIEVDDRGATSLPGVFAAGDCTTVPYKQIVVAMGEGSKAALSAFDHLVRNG